MARGRRRGVRGGPAGGRGGRGGSGGRGQQRRSTFTSTTSTSTTPDDAVSSSPGRESCGRPWACNNCYWAYPEGCLHCLEESERNAPEMNRYMDAFERYTQHCDHQQSNTTTDHAGGEEVLVDLFWDRPENREFVDPNLVRFILLMVVKFVLLKESVLTEWKERADQYFQNGVLVLAGTIKCGGSVRAYKAAERAAIQRVTGRDLGASGEVPEKHLYVALAIDSLRDQSLRCMSGHLNLLYLLDLMLPCDCLKEEIKQERQRMLMEGNEQAFFRCEFCGVRECVHRSHKLCVNCKTKCYCSKECQANHWKKGHEPGFVGHKKVCRLISEIVLLDFEGRGDDQV